MVVAGWIRNADDRATEATERDLSEDQPSPPFDDQELRELWVEGLQKNGQYFEARCAVRNGDRSFPKEWGIPMQISECMVDAFS